MSQDGGSEGASGASFGLEVLADLIEAHGRSDWGLSLVKMQPPDGLVFSDHSGTVWSLSVYRQKKKKGDAR